MKRIPAWKQHEGARGLEEFRVFNIDKNKENRELEDIGQYCIKTTINSAGLYRIYFYRNLKHNRISSVSQDTFKGLHSLNDL